MLLWFKLLRVVKPSNNFFIRNYSIPKKNKLPPRPRWLIKEEEIEESFIKGGSGPGGQKINKTNSKVQLKHIPTGLVVTSQHSRSQELNRKRAREILAEKLDLMMNGLASRTAVLLDRKVKVKQSKKKKSNRKYRKLESSEGEQEGEELIDIEEEVNQMIR